MTDDDAGMGNNSLFLARIEEHQDDEVHELDKAKKLLIPCAFLSALFNIVLQLIACQQRIKCSSAAFLQYLSALELLHAASMVMELVLMSQWHEPWTKLSDDYTTWHRNWPTLLRFVFQAVGAHLLALICLDRWQVYALVPRENLFSHQRRLKTAFTLLIPGGMVTLMAVSLSSSLVVEDKGGMEMEIHTCEHLGCIPDPGFRHWSSTRPDIWRGFFSILTVCGVVMLVVTVAAYLTLFCFLLQKIDIQKAQSEERQVLEQWGEELFYLYPDAMDTDRSPRKLPIIYEVDESDEEAGARTTYFPYSLIVLHKSCSLCSKQPTDTFHFDKRPKAENAEYEDVEDEQKRSPLHRQPKKQFETVFTNLAKRQISYDNVPHQYRHALPTTDSNDNMPIIERQFTQYTRVVGSKKNKTTQTDLHIQMATEGVPQECPQCRRRKSGDGYKFYTRQIVFSINCCCNRAAPIECRHEWEPGRDSPHDLMQKGKFSETPLTSDAEKGAAVRWESKVLSFFQEKDYDADDPEICRPRERDLQKMDKRQTVVKIHDKIKEKRAGEGQGVILKPDEVGNFSVTETTQENPQTWKSALYTKSSDGYPQKKSLVVAETYQITADHHMLCTGVSTEVSGISHKGFNIELQNTKRRRDKSLTVSNESKEIVDLEKVALTLDLDADERKSYAVFQERRQNTNSQGQKDQEIKTKPINNPTQISTPTKESLASAQYVLTKGLSGKADIGNRQQILSTHNLKKGNQSCQLESDLNIWNKHFEKSTWRIQTKSMQQSSFCKCEKIQQVYNKPKERSLLNIGTTPQSITDNTVQRTEKDELCTKETNTADILLQRHSTETVPPCPTQKNNTDFAYGCLVSETPQLQPNSSSIPRRSFDLSHLSQAADTTVNIPNGSNGAKNKLRDKPRSLSVLDHLKEQGNNLPCQEKNTQTENQVIYEVSKAEPNETVLVQNENKHDKGDNEPRQLKDELQVIKNTNWNRGYDEDSILEDFDEHEKAERNRVARTRARAPPRAPLADVGVDSNRNPTPVSKSAEIQMAVQDFFAIHENDQFPLIGKPSSLSDLPSHKILRYRMQIVGRLLLLTIVYLVLLMVPWAAYGGISSGEISYYVYRIDSATGLIQFLTFFFLSSSFRRKCGQILFFYTKK